MYFYIDKSIILFLSLLSSLVMVGQQETHYSNFMVSGAVVNSAYHGYKEATEVNISYRNQWFSLEGAPTTLASTFSLPISKKLSGGIYLLHDKIGISTNTIISPGLSYKIKGEKLSVQFGINAGLSSHTMDWGKATTVDDSDPVYTGLAKETKMIPVLGTGVMVYNDNLFFGISTPNLIESSFSELAEQNNYQRHIFITTAYVFGLNSESIKLKTGLYGKYTRNTSLSLNIGVSLIYMEKLIFGTVFNPKGSLALQAQYFFNDKFSCGVSYDILTNRLRTSQSGTLEIFLSYLLIQNKNTIYSPRYF